MKSWPSYLFGFAFPLTVAVAIAMILAILWTGNRPTPEPAPASITIEACPENPSICYVHDGQILTVYVERATFDYVLPRGAVLLEVTVAGVGAEPKVLIRVPFDTATSSTDSSA